MSVTGRKGKGRPTRIDDPEFAEQVAEAYICGASRLEMADVFGVCKDTVTNWIHDPRVKAYTSKLAEERVARLTRKVDSEIEARLTSDKIKTIDDDTLLRFRKELLEKAVRINVNSHYGHRHH